MSAGVPVLRGEAPRLSRLKKPPPPKFLLAKGRTVSEQGDEGLVLGSDRNLSLRGHEDTTSADSCQASKVCKEIVAMSANLLASTDDENKCTRKLTKTDDRQDSYKPSSASKYKHMLSQQDSSSSIERTVFPFDAPVTECRYLSSVSAHRELAASSMSRNLYNSQYYKSIMTNSSYIQHPEFAIKEGMLRSFSIDCAGSGSDRHNHCSTPVSSAKQRINSKVQGHNHDFQGKSRGTTMATLTVGKGDELALIGRNVQTILLASRILLKELDAELVKIETLLDVEKSNRDYCTTDEKKESWVTRELLQQKIPAQKPQTSARLSHVLPDLRYSKFELLKLSTSRLSHKPPLLWNLIASTYGDCCLPASKVTEYFDPLNFRFHDGTLVTSNIRRGNTCME